MDESWRAKRGNYRKQDEHEPAHTDDDPGDGEAPATLAALPDLAQRDAAEHDAQDRTDHREEAAHEPGDGEPVGARSAHRPRLGVELSITLWITRVVRV